MRERCRRGWPSGLSVRGVRAAGDLLADTRGASSSACAASATAAREALKQLIAAHAAARSANWASRPGASSRPSSAMPRRSSSADTLEGLAGVVHEHARRQPRRAARVVERAQRAAAATSRRAPASSKRACANSRPSCAACPTRSRPTR
ncbi:MAG: hypothetical protein MZW92_00120 [Comamonadaceae bacterium]|nr:hypothetical protein [Comamonadaceae bacterium]